MTLLYQKSGLLSTSLPALGVIGARSLGLTRDDMGYEKAKSPVNTGAWVVFVTGVGLRLGSGNNILASD